MVDEVSRESWWDARGDVVMVMAARSGWCEGKDGVRFWAGEYRGLTMDQVGVKGAAVWCFDCESERGLGVLEEVRSSRFVPVLFLL